ncbi:MAG: phosphosulfolactate synthase [Candidatus Aminicenantes bacterium]|nr:phosphosulfolactate synthase [Candidatus Aminicenantes bacterium]
MKAWEGCIEPVVSDRSAKPRRVGITMLLDKGMGIRETQDLVEMAAPYIDIVKFSFGTSAFYPKSVCREKIRILKEGDIKVMPGGTFMEVAIWKERYFEYLSRAEELGFDAIEVSDGTIEIDTDTRHTAISKAVEAGFVVLSEVGKKDPTEEITVAKMQELITRDMESGAFKVIVEAREAGKGCGIFDKDGKVKEDEVTALLSGVAHPDSLLWEAPIKNQQQYLILKMGTNVNLGNIPPSDILALEALRQGLRGDTLKKAYREGR